MSTDRRLTNKLRVVYIAEVVTSLTLQYQAAIAAILRSGNTHTKYRYKIDRRIPGCSNLLGKRSKVEELQPTLGLY